MRKLLLITVITLVFLLCSGVMASSGFTDLSIIVDDDLAGGYAYVCDTDVKCIFDNIFIEISPEIGDPEPQFGQISGSVHGSSGWSTFPLPFALVTAGGHSDFTNLFGNYVLHDLPLDVPLQVTASKSGWESQSHMVTLTENNPMQSIHFVLDEDDSGGGSFNVYAKYVDSLLSTDITGNGGGVR